jgi:hypothetical protein
MKLKQEYIYYKENKDSLLKEHSGSFVLIKGKEIIGFFKSEEQAYKAGLERFGNQPFFIKRVTKEEDVEEYPALALGVL